MLSNIIACVHGPDENALKPRSYVQSTKHLVFVKLEFTLESKIECLTKAWSRGMCTYFSFVAEIVTVKFIRMMLGYVHTGICQFRSLSFILSGKNNYACSVFFSRSK